MSLKDNYNTKQDCFDIFYFQKGWTYEEIAQAMSISVQSVKKLHATSPHDE